eukprot:TRINITY_DN2870_c0_g1_i2.p1 TRINITY_DN2870_c0_g1~~TRINITY_DN2870_c0_g1_i2.p1  ORF type:complete len:558 (-),score=104.92 TRINITY_DN2870_c0_g1_i2:70-1743(-)
MATFPLQLNAWVVFIMGIYLMCVSGTIYLFPTYSVPFRTLFGYETSDMNLVTTAANAGTWFGVVGGLVYDYFGPRVSSLIATTLITTGYLLMYLASLDMITRNVYCVGVMAFMVGQGSGYNFNVALNTSSKNFPQEHRGKIVGLMVCFFGLCAGLFTQIYTTFFTGSVSDFLLFLALSCGSVSFLGFLLTNQVVNPPVDAAPFSRLRLPIGYALASLIAVWVLVQSFVHKYTDWTLLPFTIVLLVLLAGFTLLPLGTNPLFWWVSGGNTKQQYIQLEGDFDDDEVESKLASDHANSGVEQQAPLAAAVRDGGDANLLQACTTIDYWLLFVIFFCAIGAGITCVNNLAELPINMETEYPAGSTKLAEDIPGVSSIPTYVSLFSVFNTFGRMGAGYFSDMLRGRLLRADWLLMFVAVMGLTQLAFAFGNVTTLYGAVIALGLSYGGIFFSLPCLTSELFGLKSFGANFGLMGLAPAMGSEILSQFVAGYINDYFLKEASIGITVYGVTNSHCLGSSCYRYTFLGTGALCVIGFVLALWLRIRQSARLKVLAERLEVEYA